MFNFFKRLKAYAFPQKKFNKAGHFKRLDLLALEERVVPATFTVVNNLDSGTGSLRQAIIDANTTAGNDTIDFAFATGTSPYTITLASALPNIAATSTAGTLTINGLGANNLIIDANQGNFSVFTIATGGNLSISGVTVMGANAAGNGGAFNNSGALSVSNSTLSGNSAGTFGGAIFNYNGALTVTNSTLSGNNATYGGGISNKFGTITISNSTLSGNSATTSGGSGGSGGGIQNNGSLTVSNSTISGNSAAKHGGGISNNSNLTISNSTLSGNSASSRGGGIYNSGNNLTLTNSTLSGNSAGTFGGGINNIGTLNIANTIIANSTSGGDYAGNGTVTLIPSGNSNNPTISANNIVTQASSSATSAWAQSVTSAQLNLGPLQNNGGPTFTQALLLGSVAIAAGNSTISNASPVSGKDQRGVNRITSDIGAYSFGIQVTTTAASGTGSLDAAITLANNTPGNDDINFNLTGTSPYTITLAAALPTILDVSTAGTLTINGLGAKNLVVDANQGNFSIFNIAAGGNLNISGVNVTGVNSTNNGGAFNNFGYLAVSNSTIEGNTGLYGGGIFNLGTLVISGSTFSGNNANIGGAIFNSGSAIFLSISNSTFSNNHANFGGGIYNDKILTVINSTFSGNSASGQGGGGIRNNVTLNVANTIIANSIGGDYNGGGSIGTNTNNLVEDGSLSGATAVDPLLGPLQDNGGPTFTMALLPGSPAIAAGDSTISNASPVSGLDQRGINRTTSDIGAFSFGIQVNTISDAVGHTGTSLRDAITLANTTPGNDGISFNLTGSGPYTITLDGTLGALPAIVAANTNITGGTAGSVTINGLGDSSLIISGNNGDANRNFNIFNIASGGNLFISGVTVSGANFTSGYGGAFNNSGTLTISNATLSGNTAIFGGGVYNAGSGILNISNSTVSGNSAGQGGAIANSSGTVTVTSSTVSGNSAGQGGGIANSGTFTFTNSTLSGNTAIFGAGVFNDGGGILNFSNSTVSGNSATQGGGIANNSGTVTVTNSTVSGNSADQNGGGGIANNGTLNIANTIIANSTSGGDYAGQVGTIGTNTNNLVEDGSLPGTSEITGDPLLGPLQNNGGPTFTQALLSGSPAIGAGSATISNASPVSGKDQRGFVRTTSDIGAYSYNFASAGDALVSLDNSNQVVLTLSSSGATLSDVHTSFNSVNNTLTITAATSGNLIASPSGGIAGVTIDNVSAANTITLDLNTLANFAGLVIVGNSGLDSVTIGTGGVDLSAVANGATNLSFTANILGTSNSTSTLNLTNAIKTKGTNASTYLSAGTINGSGLITTPIITLAALSGIGATTALNLESQSIAADSSNGKIVINNSSASAVTVSSLTSAGKIDPNGALLIFAQSGGGTVMFKNVSSAGSSDGFGVISLTNTGTGGGITVAGGSGVTSRTGSTITLQTTQGGNIVVNSLIDGNIGDGRVELFSDGSISVPGLITGGEALLQAKTGINVNASMPFGFGTITSLAGDISVTNQFNIQVNNSITATGNVTLTSQHAIFLLNPITATGKIVTLTANGSGIDGGSLVTANTVDLNAAIGIGSTTAINLEAFFVSADTTSGSININNTSGTAVSVTSLTTTGSDGITFNQTGLGGIGIDGPVSTGTGTIAITSQKGISGTGLITQANAAGSVTLNAGAGEITLNNSSNNFTGAVSLNNSGAHNVAITDTNALTFGASSLGTGTLTVNAVGITQSGAITQASSAGAATFNAGAGVISLTNLGNNFTGAVSLTNTGAHNVAITDTNAIDFGVSALGNGTFTVNAVGITQSGAITQASSAGAATFNAGAGVITLTNASNDFTGSVSLNNSGANNVGITDTNAIDFGASSLGSGTLAVTAVGITQSGAITQASSAGTVTINAGAGVITLTNASNDFTGSVSLNNSGANHVAIADVNAIDFGASALGSGTLTVTAVGITQSGAITQAANAGTVTFNAGAGVITLANPGNNFIGAVSLNNSSANNVAIVDTNDITIGVTSLGTGTFAVTGSNIKLNSNITTSNNSQTYTGNVVVNASNSGSPLILSSGTGTIDITGNLDSSSGQNYSLTFTSSGDVTISGTIGGTQALGSLLITGNDISLGNIGGANAGTTANVSGQASDLNSDTASITLTGTTYKTSGQQFYNSSAVATNFDGTRPITLNGGSSGTTVTMTSANGVETYGSLNLNSRLLSIDTIGGGGITFNDSKLPTLQAVEGPGSLVINAGASGVVSIIGAIGTGITPLNNLTITNAASAAFNGVINSDTITISDITDGGLLNFLGNLNVYTGMTVSPNGAYNVEILELSTIAGETTFGNSGLLTLGNVGSDIFNFTGGIIATNPSAINLIGTITAAGTGLITLGDSDTAITIKDGNGFVGGTSTGTITLGNAILEDGVTLTVGTGIANTLNLAAVTGVALGASSNLTINTTGAVTVSGAVGTDIGLLTITNSGGTTFQSTVNSATATITNTNGTVAFQGDLNLGTSLVTAAQAYNISITGSSNNIAAATSFLNTGTVTLNNGSGDTTTFTGGLIVTAPSSLTLQGTVKTTNATMTLGDTNTGVVLGANTTLDAGTGNINLDGTVTGSFGLTPTTSAPGITTISGANTNTTTNVTTGVVQINNTTPQTTNFVVSGGTLKGTGTIGNLTATGNGIIAPGNSPGQFITNNVSFSSTNTLQVEIIGSNASPVAGTDYDQIVVGSTGAVNLGGATLNLSSTFTGNQGTVFTILDNQDPTAAIQGTFAGLSEGAVVTVNGRAYQISYVGGTGNDVTLTVYDPATVASFTPAAGKTGTSVVITGTNFTNVSQVSFNGTVQPTYTVDSPTQITTTIPTGATTGTISITTIAGTATSSSSITIDNTAPTLN
ncbi:MAG: choice-of-anchor Q domain-containing protein, partial [Gemmataceae bacterium]